LKKQPALQIALVFENIRLGLKTGSKTKENRNYEQKHECNFGPEDFAAMTHIEHKMRAVKKFLKINLWKNIFKLNNETNRKTIQGLF
jgi:hypothetical protein